MTPDYIRSVICLVSISLIILFISAYIRYLVGVEYSTVVSFFLYFSLFLFSKKQYTQIRSSFSMLIIALPLLVINIPLRITSFQSTLITLPEVLIQLAAIILARLIYIFRQKYIRLILIISFNILVIVGSVLLYKYWFNYVNYFSFNGVVFDKSEVTICGRNKEGKILSLGHDTDFLILDFWHTACVSCIREFPELQKLSDKYKNSDRIKVVGINIPLKRDKDNMAFDLLNSKGYTFKNIIAADSLLYGKIGVTKFPTTILLGKDGYIYFRGSISDIQERIDQVLEL